jgi:hypothetical protein
MLRGDEGGVGERIHGDGEVRRDRWTHLGRRRQWPVDPLERVPDRSHLRGGNLRHAFS